MMKYTCANCGDYSGIPYATRTGISPAPGLEEEVATYSSSPGCGVIFRAIVSADQKYRMNRKAPAALSAR